MSKIVWELHVAGKDTGFEDCIRTFDSKQEAIEYVDAVRDTFTVAVGEPVDFWLYQFKQLEIGERLNG
jgi:hypothetical protein